MPRIARRAQRSHQALSSIARNVSGAPPLRRAFGAGTGSPALGDKQKIPQASAGWEGCVCSHLSVLPDLAAPLQRLQLLAALAAGCDIIGLRNICHRLDLGPILNEALKALAGGNSVAAAAKLANLDEALAARPGTAILRARAGLLAISEALTEHAAYFEAVAPG